MSTDPRKVAVLAVDVQNDFCPGGALAVPGGDRVIPVLNGLIARLGGDAAVYASRDWHPPDTRHFREFGGPWPVHCVAGTPGAQLHRDLRLPSNAVIVSKGQDRADDGYSAFEGTTPQGRTLPDDLRSRNITDLIVGGLATDYCVRASVLDACRAGFNVAVVTDAVAGIDDKGSVQALQEMQQAGAKLISSRDL